MGAVNILPGHAVKGEVWTADLEHQRGCEYFGRIPVLIFADGSVSNSRGQLYVVIPIVHERRKGPKGSIPIEPPEGGVVAPSILLCNIIQSTSEGKIYVRLGVLTPATLKLVEKRVPKVYRNFEVARHHQEKFKHS